MRADSVEQALAINTREILETMFFADIQENDVCRDIVEPRLSARLEFDGSGTGFLRLTVSESAARLLASNFLGAEDESEVSRDQTGEVVCELANMICGSVLTRLEHGETFQLSHPVLISGECESDSGLTTRYFELENGSLTVSLGWDRQT